MKKIFYKNVFFILILQLSFIFMKCPPQKAKNESEDTETCRKLTLEKVRADTGGIFENASISFVLIDKIDLSNLKITFVIEQEDGITKKDIQYQREIKSYTEIKIESNIRFDRRKVINNVPGKMTVSIKSDQGCATLNFTF